MSGKRTIALRDLIASGPVLSRAAREAFVATPSGMAYDGPPRMAVPVAPLQSFGVTYDLDLVIVDDHPDWDMHEYARVQTPRGPVWMCKDSRAGTLEQTIVADVDGIDHWLPEVPLRRMRGAVEVTDRSTEGCVDLDLAYTNIDGDAVALTYVGKAPKGPMGKRNSSTMGHSADHVLAVLDLSHRAFARRGTAIHIGGRRRSIRRILGLVPFQLALVQTQAGLSIGSWTVQASDEGATTVHGSGAVQGWALEDGGSEACLVQRGWARTLTHRFVVSGHHRELWCQAVHDHAGAEVATVRFLPALPDVTAPFSGTHTSRYVIDVNGQAGHATGEVRVTATEDGVALDVRPTAPRWTTDRPMRSVVRVEDAQATVDVTRVYQS